MTGRTSRDTFVVITQQIVVIGAGIAGLATAAALQQRGRDVTVIEQRADTSPGAGISIWPNALAALDQIGLGDRVRDAGGPVSAGAMRWRDGSWLRHPSAERLIKALGEPLVATRRGTLTDILTSAVAPGTLRRGAAVQNLVVDTGQLRRPGRRPSPGRRAVRRLSSGPGAQCGPRIGDDRSHRQYATGVSQCCRQPRQRAGA